MINLLYNIVIYYHNEDIKLLNYYIANFDNIFKLIFSNKQIKISFNINIIVSNIDQFIIKYNKLFKKNINIKLKKKEKIYENNENYLEYNKIIIELDLFNINIIELISKPYKLLDKDQLYNKINQLNIINYEIDYGINSIGFKRYFANIMTYNIYHLLNDTDNKKNKLNIFLWQIDFGTFIGLPAILHPSINKIRKIDSIIENDILDENESILKYKSLYWYYSKLYLINQEEICNKYVIDDTHNSLENLYSEFDFYYFILLHIERYVQGQRIMHFTCLSIDKTITYEVKYNNKWINYRGFPNINTKITQFKPKNQYRNNLLYPLSYGHYDKFYITDISLTKLNYKDKSHPITYNKNFTSFNEDILYTDTINYITPKELIIPHPFLAISKCIIKDDVPTSFDNWRFRQLASLRDEKDENNIDNTNDNKNNKIELLYSFMTQNDIKSYDIINANNILNNTNSSVIFNPYEENEIKNFIGGNIDCNISNKQNTKKYIDKYNLLKKIYDKYIKSLSYNKQKQNLLINKLIDNNYIICVFDKSSTIEYIKDNILSDNDIIKNYNNTYDFTKIPKININIKKIKESYKKYNNTLNIFIDEYLKKCIDLLSIKNKTQNGGINYKEKYFKYKYKYLRLKDQRY